MFLGHSVTEHLAVKTSRDHYLFTGEEKGLLGSRYYTKHLTVPREQIAANVNLDQLRPVFPLHTLTMHAMDDSTLGDTARAVASGMGIEIQKDPEPLRGLLRRSDNFPFMDIGVPATGFVFGYKPGRGTRSRTAAGTRVATTPRRTTSLSRGFPRRPRSSTTSSRGS